ncbi:MAG: maltose ABC transporter substrate-binding protein [Calditrichia bacterium]
MKYLWLVLLLMLLAFGCSGKKDNELTVWTPLLPEGRAVLRELFQEFQKEHPDITITEVYYENEELRTNFTIAAMGGSGPELVYGPSDQIGIYTIMETLQPMEPFFSDEELEEYVPEALTRANGHLYQIANRIGNHLCLIYNKKYIPKPPATFSELIKMGKSLTQDINNDGLMDRYALAWNYIEPYFLIPFITSFGGEILDTNNRPVLNTDAVVQAFMLVDSLRNYYNIIPQECDYNLAESMFKQEKAAMIINGPWSFLGYLKAGVDFGITRIPKNDRTSQWPKPFYSPWGFSINVNLTGKRLENTIKLLKFLLKKESQFKFAKRLRIIPALKSLRQDSLLLQDPFIRQSMYQLEVAVPTPIAPELRAVWDALRPYYQGVLNGSLSPQEAAKLAQQDADKKIKELWD